MTAIGNVPKPEDLDLENLEISASDLELLLEVNKSAWQDEVLSIRKYYELYGRLLPAELERQLENLILRLQV
ncbi:MAG: phosphoenolpyruvate carboxykinase (GTP), partial [Bacilli bacterium]|nr:phosphoenolpyruvate carboxykinase (GTP) [Bacilli bacterium]